LAYILLALSRGCFTPLAVQPWHCLEPLRVHQSSTRGFFLWDSPEACPLCQSRLKFPASFSHAVCTAFFVLCLFGTFTPFSSSPHLPCVTSSLLRPWVEGMAGGPVYSVTESLLFSFGVKGSLITPYTCTPRFSDTSQFIGTV